VRYQAIVAFARVARDDGAAVGAVLSRALDDEDPAIRYIALRVAEERLAMQVDTPSLSARAERLLEGPDEALAVVAGLYLARQGDARGRATVLAVIDESRATPEIEDEQACIELAGELALRESIPHLERRAWGTRRVLRTVLSWGAGDPSSCAWHARIALARMGHARARDEILADLASWRRETREAAVVAVGRARIREGKPRLETLGGSVDGALLREALLRLAIE